MTPRARRAALVAALALLAGTGRLEAAPFEDTMAQRVLACTGCHGSEGRAAPDGYYPRIAGKPAGYLYNQLLNFRDERRHYGLMNGLLKPLDDAYLREIAEHFASLEIAYPPPAATTLGEAEKTSAAALVTRGDAKRGVPPCIACHGTAMTGTAPFVPGLLGLPRDYLNAQLGAWREDKRQAQVPDCMSHVAKAIAPDEISAISAWLAAQPLPADARPASAFSGPLPFECGGLARTDRGAPPEGHAASGARR